MMEKIFFAFLVCTAFVNGVPVRKFSKKKHLIITTKVSKLDGNVFNVKIGECTYKELVYKVLGCKTKFHLSFRTDKKTPCSERFAVLKKCYLGKVEDCFRPVVSSQVLEKIMAAYDSSMAASEKIHCGKTEFNYTSFFSELPKEDECPRGTMQEMNQCMQKWYETFKKNPGSPTLCRYYHMTKKCLKRSIDKCSFDFSKSQWIYEEAKINPFCDKQQMANLLA